MKARLERFLNRRWYSPQPAPWWLRAWVPLYRALSASRRSRPEKCPPCPVIVVGNITVGGSGKTPVVAALARVLSAAGYAPAIISRGYGARAGDGPRAVTPSSDPAEVGDEPVLLTRRAGCAVWVCRDRRAALEAAVAGGANVVLADDGLQHPRLPRSYEICVIDGQRGFGNGYLLPAGPLRQNVDRLASVDEVLVKGSGSDHKAMALPGQVFGVQPGAPYRLGALAESTERPGAGELDAVCAIGNPESFFELLEALGYRIRRHAFPDHHDYSAEDLSALPGPVIVTEKDAVKLERLTGLPETWVLPIKARLPEVTINAAVRHVREFLAP